MRHTKHRRWYAGVLLAGAVAWLAAGVLLAWRPSAVRTEQVYAVLVPIALLALAVGVAGLEAWLGGFAPRTRRRGLFRGFATGLEAMSSQRHRVVAGGGSAEDGDGVTARGLGAGALRAGAALVIVSSLLAADGTGLRPTLFFGWFLFFAGALVLGLAVAFTEDLPRWAGALLAVGSLLVLPVAAVSVGGGAQPPEALGPVVASPGDVPVAGLLLWTASGAAWAWLGAGLWSRGQDIEISTSSATPPSSV